MLDFMIRWLVRGFLAGMLMGAAAALEDARQDRDEAGFLVSLVLLMLVSGMFGFGWSATRKDA